MRSSSTDSRSSLSRAISGWANDSKVKSANGAPRQSASALRSVAERSSAPAPRASSTSSMKRSRSSWPGSSRSWYPGGFVTRTSGPSTFRSWETKFCREVAAVFGGLSPQSASTR